MESTSRIKPNTHLRRQRLLRGWSLQEVVDQLCALCEEENDIPGVTADMVSKWERGERKPSRFYQTKLCLLYNTPADQLGFMEEALSAPEPSRTGDIHSKLSHSSSPSGFSVNTQVVTTLPDGEQAEASDILAANLLVHSGRQLALLTALGWTQHDILNALEIIVRGETAMAKLNRRQVLQLGAGMLLLGGSNVPVHERLSAEERVEISQAIGEGIVAGWTLFHTAGTAQVLAVSQSQLMLVQQAHTLLHPDALPFLYSGAHRLMGAAFYFQQRYKEALYAHEQAYRAALETENTWNIAESLSWQAYVYQECGKYDQAIQVIEEALRLLANPDDEAQLRLTAHLLACWSENDTWLQRTKKNSLAQEKLEASATLLEYISPNEEFDRTKWLQQAGNCAMIIEDYQTATRHFEEALTVLPPHWTLRHAITLVPLAVAYARKRERDMSLATAEKALPVLKTMNAPILNKQFAQYLQQDLLSAYPDDSLVSRFVTKAQQHLSQLRF